jgi:hypothetical protein
MTRHAPFWGRKIALYNYQRLAYLCRKSAIFVERKGCKSLRERELRIYGIFENSRIVLSQYMRKVRSSWFLVRRKRGF